MIKNSYYNFGFSKFGPFLYGFSNWLIKNVITNTDYSKTFLFARDGYMMKKAIDEQVEKGKYNYEYVYFSRKSIRQALLYNTSSFSDSLKYISRERYITYGKLLEYYGFDYKTSLEICEKEKINIDEQILLKSILTNRQAFYLYKKLKKIININSKKQATLLLKYLNQIDFAGSVAIVDIGWHGSMQYYLEQFAREHEISVKIIGYYLGTETKPEVTGKTFGYVYANDNLKLKKDLLCCFGLLERLFQSRVGSTFGYRLEGKKVCPILGEYEYKNDKKLISHINDMQEGAIACIRYLTQDKRKRSKLDFILPLIKVGKTPTLAQTELFKDFYLMDGSKEYFVSQKSLFRYSPKEFMHSLSNSPWKTGFMKSVFKVPFPYYKIYDLLKK